jgi:TolB-like protein
LPDPRSRIIPFDAPTSIAVLPFVNMSSDTENEYFAEGLSEETRYLLARGDNLRVIGRTSSHAVAEKSLSSAEIGAQLGVTIFLEGSVRKYENRVRISAQLIRANDGTSIWSDSYDQTLEDIFQLQDDVAASVLKALQVQVDAQPRRGNPTKNPDAYSFFLRARSAIITFDLREAEKLLQQAATQLGPDYRRGSVRALDEASLTYPNDPKLLEMQIWLLTEIGYLNEAVILSGRYLKVDPLSHVARSFVGATTFATGNTTATLEVLPITDAEIPDLNNWTWTSFGILVVEGQIDLAKATFAAWLQERGVNVPELAQPLIEFSSDPVTGAAYSDTIVPDLLERLKSDTSFAWQEEVISLYLYFGHLDRYFELIMATNPSDKT